MILWPISWRALRWAIPVGLIVWALALAAIHTSVPYDDHNGAPSTTTWHSITPEQFSALHLGMTRAQARAILGKPRWTSVDKSMDYGRDSWPRTKRAGQDFRVYYNNARIITSLQAPHDYVPPKYGPEDPDNPKNR